MQTGVYRGFGPTGPQEYGEATLTISDDALSYRILHDSGEVLSEADISRSEGVRELSPEEMKTLFPSGEDASGICVVKTGICFIYDRGAEAFGAHAVYVRWVGKTAQKWPPMPWLYSPAQLQAGRFEAGIEAMAKYGSRLVPL